MAEWSKALHPCFHYFACMFEPYRGKIMLFRNCFCLFKGAVSSNPV